MNSSKNIEWAFFKYAFPCSQVLLQLGKISQEKYEYLRKMFNNREAPDRETLERVFSAAFVRIKRLAKKMNKDYWDADVIHEYWDGEGHNNEIHIGDGFYEKAPESFKDLCRINIAEVVERKGGMLRVRYGDEDVGNSNKVGEDKDNIGNVKKDESEQKSNNNSNINESEKSNQDGSKSNNDSINERMVFDTLVPSVQIGDKVRIHYGYAVERVEDDG
jgi:hypothetical protein